MQFVIKEILIERGVDAALAANVEAGVAIACIVGLVGVMCAWAYLLAD